MQLEEIAFMFWRANCRGCGHRQVRDIPNLATYGEQRLTDEQHRADVAAAAEADRTRVRQERAAERASRVAGEPQSVREFVALVDGVDAESPDSRAQTLLDLARAVPERCTEIAGRILVETALVVVSDPLLETLDSLQRADRLPADPLLAAALWQLAARPSQVAASIVVRLRAGLRAGDLNPLIPQLVWLSGTATEPFDQSSPYVEAISLAADVDLPAVLDELCDGIGDVENESRRGRWSSAAAELITMHPETAEVLAEALARSLRLPGSESIYAGSPHTGIHSGLVAALAARPAEIDAIFNRLAPSLSEPARESVFHAYDRVLTERRRGAMNLTEGDISLLVAAVFARLTDDWGPRVADDAVDVLDSISRDTPILLAERVDAVFGALLAMVAHMSADGNGPAATLLQPPNPLAALEHHGRLMMRNANARRLRDVVGRLAPLRPEPTLDGVEAILDTELMIGVEAADELRSHAVSLLGDIGVIPEFGPRVLPRLVSLSLGQDIILRTRAIEALGKLHGAPHRNLPADVIELLPGWLADPYKGPHRAAIDLIVEGWPVPDAVLYNVLGTLVVLGGLYASDDARVLHEVLLAVWKLSQRLAVDEQAMFQRFVLTTAEHLSIHDLERFVEWYAPRSCDPRNVGVLADRVLQVLTDSERISNPNRREDPLLRQLRNMSPEVLAPRTGAILDAARGQLPYIKDALEYLEVLQRAGDYANASSLAAEVLAYLPETTEAEVVRAGVVAVSASADVELACLEGNLVEAQAALGRWETALADRAAAASRRVDPWEML
jgi:hypothetical protein